MGIPFSFCTAVLPATKEQKKELHNYKNIFDVHGKLVEVNHTQTSYGKSIPRDSRGRLALSTST